MTDWNKELDLLKEYIDWRVDEWCCPTIWLSIANIPHLNIEELFRAYMEQGIMYVTNEDTPSVSSHRISFEEWKDLRAYKEDGRTVWER
jgi:hypothetical protein